MFPRMHGKTQHIEIVASGIEKAIDKYMKAKVKMKLEFGYGNINVMSYGDEKGNYGVAFRIMPERHAINAREPEAVTGRTIDDVKPDLQMEFSNSESVQVVIEKLAMVRDDLRAAEHRVHLTASGAGGRGQNSLQSSFIADDQSAKHGGR